MNILKTKDNSSYTKYSPIKFDRYVENDIYILTKVPRYKRTVIYIDRPCFQTIRTYILL